jgi:hypothetical protein
MSIFVSIARCEARRATCENFKSMFAVPVQLAKGGGVKWSWEQLLAILQAFPPMSTKRSITDDPTHFSAFKISLITKETCNFENR